MNVCASPLSALCATLLVAALGGVACPAQSFAPARSTDTVASAENLPSAPSSSLSDASLSSSSKAGSAVSSSQDAPQQTKPAQADPPQPPANETSAERKKRLREQSAREVKAEEKQRIAGVVPDFNVVLGGVPAPLTPGQKLDLVYHSSRDPYTIGLTFLIAGYDEISGTHNGYGWGPGGYFKRFGAQYADTVDGALIGNALLPILLHQDPRYYRKGTGSIKSRIIYSALSTVICKGDNGKNQFNISNVAGNYISGAISNLYYPASERGVGLVFSTGTVVTAEGAFGAQLLEFSPDIVDGFKRRHREKLARKAEAAAAADSTPAAHPAP